MNERTNQSTSRRKTNEAPVGQRGWRLLSSAQPQAAKRAGDARGLLAASLPGKPRCPKRRQDPPPPLGHCLSLLIWRWNVRYPHSSCWGRTSFLFRHTRAHRISTAAGGAGGPRPVPPGALPQHSQKTRGCGWGRSQPQPHGKRRRGDCGLSAWRPEFGEGVEIPGESTRAGGGGEVPKLCGAGDPAGPMPRAPAPPPHPRAPGGMGRRTSHSHAPFSSRTKPGPRGEPEDDLRKLRQRARCADGPTALARGPAPRLGGSAARNTFCSTGVSQEGRPTHLLRTPQTPRHAVLPPSLRSKGLGFRLLGANFLPLGKRSQGFAAEPVGGRLESWRGRATTPPRCSGGPATRARPRPRPGPPPPPPRLGSRDPRGPSPPVIPPPRHACSPGEADRVPALAGGALASAFPGRPRLRPGAGD